MLNTEAWSLTPLQQHQIYSQDIHSRICRGRSFSLENVNFLPILKDTIIIYIIWNIFNSNSIFKNLFEKRYKYIDHKQENHF